MTLKKVSTITLVLLLIFGTLAFVILNQAQSSVMINLTDNSNLTISQILQNNTSLSTLLSLTQTANLTSILNGTLPLTLFAPINTAFANLPNATMQNLLNDTTMLSATLAYHISPNIALSPDKLRDILTVSTGLINASLNVSVTGTTVKINNASITGSSIVAKNGIINLIDTVLTPPTNNTNVFFPAPSNVTDRTNQVSPYAAGYRNGTSYTTFVNASSPQVNLQMFAGNFVAPMGVVPAVDGTGRIFVVDQIGVVWIIAANGTKLPQPFLNITSKIVPLSPTYDERGLLSMAFSPNYTQNGKIYVHYDAPLRQGAPANWSHTIHIAEFTVAANDSNMIDVSTERTLMLIDHPYANHNGGPALFGPDGYLYIALGDGGNADDVGIGHTPAIGNAQDLTNVLGKVLRIDVGLNITKPPTTQVKNITLYEGEILVNNQTRGAFGLTRNNLTSPGPTLNFTVGDSVNMTVINVGTMPHAWAMATQANASLPSLFNASIASGSNPLAVNASGSVTFNVTQAGNFSYFCLVPGHIALGMTGTVIVSAQNQTQNQTQPQTAVKNMTLYEGEILVNNQTRGAFGLSANNLTSPGPTLNFTVGDMVNMTVVNVGTLPHAWQMATQLNASLTALFNASIAPTTYMQAGQNGSVVFNVTQAGSFNYFCPVPGHIALVMWGNVTVTPQAQNLSYVIFTGSNVTGTRPYNIPPTNPFLNVTIRPGDYGPNSTLNGTVLPEIYSYGHRNPAFASFYQNTTSGNNSAVLMIAEAGQNLFEEVSIISPGANYGWNLREGTHPFNPANDSVVPANGTVVGYLNESLIGPIFEGGHDLGSVVIGGNAYWGSNITTLQGKYVFSYFNIPTSNVPAPTPSPSPSASPNATASPSPSASPSPTVSPTPTSSPNATASPSPSPSPNATATPTPNATATPSPTPVPTNLVGNMTILVATPAAGWNASTGANYPPDNRMWPTQMVPVANAQTVNVTGFVRSITVDQNGELYVAVSGVLGPNANTTTGKIYKLYTVTAAPPPSPSPIPTASPTPSPTASTSPQPTPTPTTSVAPTPTPTVSTSPSPTASASPTPTGSPTASATPTPSGSPSTSPSASPSVSASPSTGPVVQPCDSSGANKKSFDENQSIYVKGSGFPSSGTFDVYIVNGATSWTNGMAIPVSLGGLNSTTEDANGNIPSTLLWSNPPSGTYSVILDVNRNHVYDSGVDAVFTGITVGSSGGGISTTVWIVIAVIIILIIIAAAVVLSRRRVE